MKQVAVGIIVKEGLVLACQRRRDAAYPLKWEFPGGKLEDGETPEDAVIRELREELEINAVVDQEFHRQEWIYPQIISGPPKNSSFRVFYFLIRAFTGRPVNHVFEQIRWVTPAELNTMDILEGNRPAIELLVRGTEGSLQRRTA